MAASIEANHDDKGIVWPMSIAPYHVIVTMVRPDDEATMTAAESIYDALIDQGVEVLLDDRDERPGVKFNDAELIGVPLRVTVGPRGLGNGIVELQDRRTGESVDVTLDTVVSTIAERVQAAT